MHLSRLVKWVLLLALFGVPAFADPITVAEFRFDGTITTANNAGIAATGVDVGTPFSGIVTVRADPNFFSGYVTYLEIHAGNVHGSGRFGENFLTTGIYSPPPCPGALNPRFRLFSNSVELQGFFFNIDFAVLKSLGDGIAQGVSGSNLGGFSAFGVTYVFFSPSQFNVVAAGMSGTITSVSVPEPGTLWVLGGGLVGVIAARQRLMRTAGTSSFFKTDRS
jgi:hypothetical protein